MFHVQLNAGIQATLHNAHFKRDGGGIFTPDMFLPGYKPPVQSWQQQKEMVERMMAMRKPLTTDQMLKLKEGEGIFKQRCERAKKLRDSGASLSDVRAAMEGVQ